MGTSKEGQLPFGVFVMTLIHQGAIDEPTKALDAFSGHLSKPLGDFNAQYDIILYEDQDGNNFVALEYNTEGLTEIVRYKATPKRALEGYEPEPQHLLHNPPIGLEELFSGDLHKRTIERISQQKTQVEKPGAEHPASLSQIEEITRQLEEGIRRPRYDLEPPRLAPNPEEKPRPIDPTFEE